MSFDARALSALDFPRVLSALAERSATTLGAERARALRPSDDAGRIARELDEVEDALFGVSLSLGGIQDIRDLHARAGEGRVLVGQELLNAAYSLDGAMTVKRAINANSRGPLRELAVDLGDHSELVRRVLSALDRDGGVRDDASPRLRDLRKRIEPLRGRIRERLAATLDKWADVLQEHIVTIRRDRYVLPVQASRVGQVQGIIVDASATGQTYFVEPAAVTQLNNELTRLILDEEAEVRRILTELSGLLASDAAVPMTLAVIGELDLIAAKARLARDWRLNRPEQVEGGSYDLREVRHPLIENPVANDLALGETKLLLITGPNMGGKTATIKTLGLAVLMHQCGMYVAAASARLPVVRDVLVDIGDEQSIEASLSTFASHLKHLRYVLRHAAPDTLVLVDELGSGTDPNEGAALAQALIECLLTQDARGVITSHLSPLKLFALETPGLKNASMGFDVDTLAPTYVLQVGQPGRSFALAIAQRMGLPADVLGRAEELLGPDAGLMERMLEGLERERADLRAQLDATAAARRDAEAELGRVRAERETLEARRNEMLAEASQKAESLYADAVERVRTLRARAQEDSARPRVMQELRELRVAAQKTRPAPAPREDRGDPIRVGSSVDVPAYNASGQVLELRGDDLVVQLGVMKVGVKRRDVRLKQEPKPQAPKTRGPRFTGTAPTAALKELQLRGMGVEEAVEELRTAILEAHALKETPLRVVHGKGQGVLRRLLREYLKNDRKVESFHDAEPNQGGHGVTIVNIRR
ncbi:endonuclease MutS2 [Deinococcus soli (ex Cha et al. 2016)]|uniref:Endonuclease MutS2 n=2 Tax=Deinococcus soli (ex Cha et al. 2016) TaxID=1309411 RepID=A0AAE4BMP3_9DEIO|nr:endonuclease MutS2 [Deinococcus soli (ex Cha et al. 2016)]MDR6219290.1 DNA mismatch repair protein MutS2 [Deinococcus soli (ex Cha et al. 2016)]MDR6329539.1 DNA mismatch repair protein MutS2 [Deinococcus soli (ex Cha et al. 2016)]MDR6752199.1 DNA mismatch repair protein MutS2 [Deinococcus soli (ex Cha et al. 2016)]